MSCYCNHEVTFILHWWKENILLNIFHGGGGVSSIIKVYTCRCAAGMGYTCHVSKYMNWYHFHFKSISIGYLFHPKSIWMGKIWKIVYEKVQFSLWEVYEWVFFLTSPRIWIGWGPGTPAARPYPKQNRKSTEGYSKSIVRKNNDKFGKRIGLNK